MLRNNWKSIINLGVRGLTLIAKLFFSIFIVKFLSVPDLGAYGIITTTITLLVFLVGLDFFSFNTRNLLMFPTEEWGRYLKWQFSLHLISYLILFPLYLAIMSSGVIQKEFVIITYFILISEHFSQELYRVFVTLKIPIFSNVLLFLRSGLWIFLYSFITYSKPEWTLNQLDSVLYFWLGGSIFSFLVGIVKLLSYKMDWAKGSFINYKWVINGIKVSLPFFFSTISYKLIEFSNRYFIDYWYSKEEVGIFTFFAGISNGVQVFVYSTVIIFYSPKLISTKKHETSERYRLLLSEFKRKVTYTTILASFLAVLVINLVLPFLDNHLLTDNVHVFYLLVIGAAILNFSFIQHYNLYVHHRDGDIFKATLIGTIFNLALNFVLIKHFSIVGASIVTVISYLFIWVIKWHFNRKVLIK